MASLSLSGFDELNAVFAELSDIPDDVTEKALNAMAEVAAEKIRSSGQSAGVFDPGSSVHILEKVKPQRAKLNSSGGYQDITFTGSRTRNGTRTTNTEIAFENEFGQRRQTARPFVRNAMEKNVKAIADPGIEIVGDWIEKTFEQ